jgi:hypothetical protein
MTIFVHIIVAKINNLCYPMTLEYKITTRKEQNNDPRNF